MIGKKEAKEIANKEAMLVGAVAINGIEYKDFFIFELSNEADLPPICIDKFTGRIIHLSIKDLFKLLDEKPIGELFE